MKHLIFTLAFILLGISSMIAQKSVNIQVGLNSTMLDYESDIAFLEDKAHLGWHAGVSLRFGDRVYIQPGLMFYSTNLGFGDKNSTIEEVIENRSVNYLKIPLSIGIDALRVDWVTLRAYVGATGNTVLSVEDNLLVSKEDFDDFHINGLIGVGADFGPLTVDFSFEPGITKVFENIDNSRANVFSLSAGFAF